MSLSDLFTPRQRQGMTWGAVALVIVLLIAKLGPALTPFLLAIGLAYLLEPLVERLERLRIRRTMATLLAMGLLLVLTLLAIIVLVPVIQHQIVVIRDQVPAFFDLLNTRLIPRLQSMLGNRLNVDLNSIRENVMSHLSDSANTIASTAFTWLRSSGGVAMSFVGLVLVVPMVLFYVLLDWPQMTERLRTIVPPRWQPQVFRFLDEVNTILGQALRGQFLVMLILSALYSAGLFVAGFELWLPIGLITGMLSFIPYVGYGIGLVLGALAAVSQFGWFGGAIRVALVFGTGQALESFVITPRIIGGSIGLHPLAVIFALVAFGSLMGFTGVLLAVPLAAVASVGLRWIRTAYFESSFYRSDLDRGGPAGVIGEMTSADLVAEEPGTTR